MIQLRDYQILAVNSIYKTIASGRTRVACSLPTGAGKSMIIAKIASDAAKKNRKTLILVHRKALVGQLESAIQAFSGITPHIVASGFKSRVKDSLIIIAMVQTLERRALPEGVGLIILDEAHITAYFDVFEKCLDKYLGKIWALSKVPVIGFSATFWRTNQREGYCRWFNAKVQGISPRGLINRGFLTPARLFTYDESLDTSSLEVDGSGDFTLSSIRSVCGELYLNDVVEKWQDGFKDLKTIFFCSMVEQTIVLKDSLKALGVRAEVIKGNTPKKQREDILAAFKNSSIKVIINVGCLTEGFDEPSVECVVLARPSKSQALIVQMIGRALRLFEGKKVATILDFGECIKTLVSKPRVADKALEDDLFEYNDFTLCSRFKPKPPQTFEKNCESCEEPISVFLKECPHCGHIHVADAKSVPDIVKFPGLIEYLTKNDLKVMRFFRRQLKSCFNENLPLNVATARTFEAHGCMPDLNWGRGAIFNELYPKQNYAFFNWFLGSHLQLDDELVNYSLAIEFGDYSNSEDFNPKHFFKTDDIKTEYAILAKDSSVGEMVMIEKLYSILKGN